LKKIIVYPALLNYRKDVFEILSQKYNFDLIFGETPPQEGQKIISDHNYLKYNNYKFYRFFFSKNLLSQILKYDSIVFLGFNPLYIDYILVVIFIKIFYREKKIYWWGHGTLGNQGFFGRKFRLFFYKLSEGLLSYNKYCFLPDKNFFDIKKVFYVGNSNNFDSIYQGDFILNKKPFFDVIYIGRLQKRKGVVEFSKLWDQVQTRFLSITGVNIRFNIYGDGECKNDIVSCDNLILHGHKNPTQIRQILLSSDLAVCPKAVGLALYHVNWFGIPLITLKNNIDHGPEINDLKEKINGSFFNEFNVDSILEEILFWFQEIKVNNLLIKEQCRNEVKNFSPSSVAKKINKVIYGN
jgi:glycosyltransferase involved in cell wall biosynthesis